MAITYGNLFIEIRNRFRRAGIDAAALEARELLCFASGKSREQYLRDTQLYATHELEARAEELVQRRLSGEPIAYLIGEWEFYGLPLDISRSVLVPRTDTELLARTAIQYAQAAGQGARVLDLCAGSGCIGLAVAANAPESRVVLADISDEALHICRQNIRRNDLNARVVAMHADALQAPSQTLWDFDVIVCNPPYIPSGDIETLDKTVRFEPTLALDGGEDGLKFYRAVADKWEVALRLGGRLLFEVGIHQGKAVRDILGRAGYSEIDSLLDDQGIERVVIGQAHG